MKIINYLLFTLAIFFFGNTAAVELPIIDQESIFHPVIAQNGMVASQDAVASQAGLNILRQGGNAVDAAVATGFALAVTLPKAGNLGGGGFMLIHLAKTNATIALDYREMAPLRAHRDMFLDSAGNVDKDRARNTFLSAGIPGTVAGLTEALENYGSLPLQQVMAAAIHLAEQGFPLSHELSLELEARRQQLSRSAAGRRIFFKEDGSGYQAGELFIQKDLAWTLKQIATQGRQAFYQGKIADKIVASSKQHKGLIDYLDLKSYRVAKRRALSSNYRGYQIISMPPPSSGGVHVIQMLNILENFNLREMGHNSAAYLHTLSEVMKRAYADRSEYLGDPDFARVPMNVLLAKNYAARIARNISRGQATPADEIKPGHFFPEASHDTTHYSVADKDGNVVANTYTLNFSYGSGIVVQGAGFLMNNEMDDFSAKPGIPNAFGLLGSAANAIMPRKRPLSSMTPTLVMKNGKPMLAVGSPGGSKIINVVLQLILNVIEYDMNIAEASSVPRIHHQWYPDVLSYEPGISPDTLKLLGAKKHQLKKSRALGSTQSIMLKGDFLYGASDPRRPGAATVGY